ncbi:MAG: hypothetical protein JWQ46_1683 [Phenylobacterium sp.]|nr:hypothetical protein [Phenylobacterium sp.]
MTDETQSEESASTGTTPSSVAHGVLESFFKRLGETDGYTDVAVRLRKVVVEDGNFAEAALRTAIFGDSGS